MRCDDYKNLMIDSLYDEISKDDRSRLDEHLKTCENCRIEFNKLKSTSKTLQKWEDIEVPVNLTFIKESKSIFHNLIEKIRPVKVLYGFAIGFAAMLLLLSITNTKIEIQDGNFNMDFNLFGQKKSAQADANMITKADFDKFKNENMNLVAQLIEAKSNEQKMETMLLMQRYYQELDNQRKSDLKLVSHGLEQYRTGTESRIEQTDRLVGGLIKYISAQSQ